MSLPHALWVIAGRLEGWGLESAGEGSVTQIWWLILPAGWRCSWGRGRIPAYNLVADSQGKCPERVRKPGGSSIASYVLTLGVTQYLLSHFLTQG